MKILVISDSHGNIANLKHVLGFGKKIGVEAIMHAGDWDNLQSLEAILSSGLPLYSVLGNADIDPLFKFKDFLEIELGGRKIGITHKPSDNKKFFAGKKLDIIFNGHLHSNNESEFQGIKLIRPGAIVNGINFTIYETHTNTVEFFNE